MNPPKKLLLLCWCSVLSLAALTTSPVHAQTLAFPGAQGFGSAVTGGRNGTVYHVTTLADSGAGSFRDAVSVANRIVVFDIGGYITLNTEVAVKANITIAGQTAPGGGIGVRGAEVSFGSQNNIIVRHVRFRPGSGSGDSENGLNLYQAHGVILDHVSIEFAKWNNIDAATGNWQTFPISDITVQNSIIADPIGQQFGAHTEAPNGTWSWFNNLFANSHNRNPLAKVNTVFINNVLYNCDAGYTTHTSTQFKHDIVNNYFVAGPASGGNMPWFQIDNNQSIFFTGNLRDGSLDGALNGSTTVPLPGYQGGGTVLGSAWSPVTTSYPTVSPASAFRRVVSLAGAMPRDQMDALVVSQAQTLGSGTTGTGAGTRGPDGALYTTETQTGLGNGGFGTISGGTLPTDTDNDGMPNYWERTFGWNTNSADSMVILSSGYARLEEYINWLADAHVAGNANSTVDLNLSQYIGGFVNSPAVSVSGAVNGSVSLLADGRTARFTPNAGFSGMARYNFTVTDSAGSSMTQTVNVLVQPSVPPAPAVLMATPGNAQVALSWTSSSGATSYRVKRSTSNGGPYSNINTNTGTAFNNTGLVNGTTYYYVVSAVNGAGESPNSGQASATPSAGGGSTGVTNTIQVEAGVLAGGVTIDSNNAGFNGTGFANFPTTGGSVQFNNVAGGSGGAGTLTIRYALGITTARTGQLVVNGTTTSITFSPSGGWTTWTNKVVSITLNSGTGNTIRFQSNGQDLGNLDQITVAKP